MGKNRFNQFMQVQMRQKQTDTEKLIKIASFLRKEYNFTVQREPILTFDKNDGHLVDFSRTLTKNEYYKYTIHVPDLIFFVGKKMWIMEIDGWIHDTKTSVVRKDIRRNECYELAKLNVMIINEWETMIKQGIPPEGGARVDELIPEIRERISQML